MGNLASPASDLCFFFPGLDFIRVLICEADLLVEIRLDELESFSAGLEKDVIEFRDGCACAYPLGEHLWSDWPHINHKG